MEATVVKRNPAYIRNVKNMLGGMDKRIIDLFGLYEYKPTARAKVAYLGVYDIDLIRYLKKNFSYKIRAEGYDPKAESSFTEFVFNENDWWKARKIIFKFMRVPKWQEYFDEELGSDWREWAFIIQAHK